MKGFKPIKIMKLVFIWKNLNIQYLDRSSLYGNFALGTLIAFLLNFFR